MKKNVFSKEYGEYMAFYQPMFSPAGGLSDCIGVFDYLHDAWAAIDVANQDDGFSNVLNLKTQRVYRNKADTKGTTLSVWLD
tara:strand:- start:3243 stop:3488 length:246 start_codon:yes stop_codon:yes gene_type:complete